MDFSKSLFGQHFSHKFNMIFGCCTCNSPFISSNVPPSFCLVPCSAFSPYPGVKIYILFYPLSSGWIWLVVDTSKRTEVRGQWCWDTCSLSLLVCSLTQFLSRRLLLQLSVCFFSLQSRQSNDFLLFLILKSFIAPLAFSLLSRYCKYAPPQLLC